MPGRSVREQVEGTRGTPKRRSQTPLRKLEGRLERPVKTGTQVVSGVTLSRAVPHHIPKAELDQFGLPTAGKYRTLGPRNRQNVQLAIAEGMRPTGTGGTTEEMCCYGELRRRGFEYGEGAAARCFEWQVPFGGSVLDFFAWDQGNQVAIRPMNKAWHGHLDKIASDQAKADEIKALGADLFDIWSGDSLSDFGIEFKFSQWFGAIGA